MATHYRGFKLFTIPREGGHFVRLRSQKWVVRTHEAPFIETGVFPSEAEALREAKRLLDADPWSFPPG